MKAPSRLVQIALVYVMGVALAMTAATWTVALAGGQGADAFWPAFRGLWEGAGSAFLPTVLIGGVLQAIVYRSLKANKTPVFVAAFVALTCVMAFGIEALMARAVAG